MGIDLPVMAAVLIVLATALLGAATDAVVESAIDGGDAIVMFGQTIATPGTAGTLGILAALSATSVLAWVAAIAHARGRRLERRLSDELDERWEDLSQRVAGELGRKTLLEWRVVELRNQVDELVTKRDELLEEMNAVRERTGELQRMIRRQREEALALASEPETPSEATDIEEEPRTEQPAAPAQPQPTPAAEAEPAAAVDRPSEEIVVLPELGRPTGMHLVGADRAPEEAEPSSDDEEDDAESNDGDDTVAETRGTDSAEASDEDEVISLVEPEPARTGDEADNGRDDTRPWLG
jgi:hypothetical protein